MDLVLNDLQGQMQKLREDNARLERENVDLSMTNRRLLDSLEEKTSEASIRDWDAMEILERHYRDLVGTPAGLPSSAADGATDACQEAAPKASPEALSESSLGASPEAADEAAGGGPATPRMAPWQSDLTCCRSPEGRTAATKESHPESPQQGMCDTTTAEVKAKAAKAQYFLMSTPRVDKNWPESLK
jgi:hypothetical protein